MLETNPEKKLVKLSFLHPSGPNASFQFPAISDILTTDARNILSVIDPPGGDKTLLHA